MTFNPVKRYNIEINKKRYSLIARGKKRALAKAIRSYINEKNTKKKVFNIRILSSSPARYPYIRGSRE